MKEQKKHSQKHHDIRFDLKKTRRDKRDYSYRRTFGAVSVSELPEEYIIKPFRIKDQGSTDFCTAFASTEVAEDQDNIEFDPGYHFQKSKLLEGGWREWGVNIRTACQVAVDYGFLPKNYSPFIIGQTDRDIIANPENWKPELDTLAAQYKKQRYFSADGFNDLFDNIRMAMWMNKDDNASVITGSLWRTDWIYAPVIPKLYSSSMQGGHAFKIIGWKKIDNEIYLVIQNSWGDDMGDEGLYYFPRSVVNKEFSYGGAFLFSSKEGTIKKMSLMITLLSKLVGLLNQLIAKTK